MVKLSLCVIPSRAHSDGSLDIKIKVTNNSSTAYIQTQYRVDNIKQWKNGQIVKRGDASVINYRLIGLLMKYKEALESISGTSVMTASEVKRCLETYVDGAENIKEYMEGQIAMLYKNKQDASARKIEYTLKKLVECFGEHITFQQINMGALVDFEEFMFKKGYSNTTVNIYMNSLKAVINSAINKGLVEYKRHPFRGYTIPDYKRRDICISKEELSRLRDAKFEGRRAKNFSFARDMFMLSFYCAGINLIDLANAVLDDDVLTFVRRKTVNKKKGEKEVSFTLQPEAREIIDRYIGDDGKLPFIKQFGGYKNLRDRLVFQYPKLGKYLGFEKPFMYYAARKTFCQFGYELGIPLYILEYAIGHTIKEESNRPIFSYIKIMRKHADKAIRRVIDYSFNMEEDDIMSN